jgi:hypothetical protein
MWGSRRRNQLAGGVNRAPPRLDFWKESKCKFREMYQKIESVLEKNILLSRISINTGSGLNAKFISRFFWLFPPRAMHGKQISAATNSDTTIEEPCFLYGPCRDDISKVRAER